jgi:hypothetical protein
MFSLFRDVDCNTDTIIAVPYPHLVLFSFGQVSLYMVLWKKHFCTGNYISLLSLGLVLKLLGKALQLHLIGLIMILAY